MTALEIDNYVGQYLSIVAAEVFDSNANRTALLITHQTVALNQRTHFSS